MAPATRKEIEAMLDEIIAPALRGGTPTASVASALCNRFVLIMLRDGMHREDVVALTGKMFDITKRHVDAVKAKRRGRAN
jgi:hypothetical protein